VPSNNPLVSDATRLANTEAAIEAAYKRTADRTVKLLDRQHVLAIQLADSTVITVRQSSGRVPVTKEHYEETQRLLDELGEVSSEILVLNAQLALLKQILDFT